jgi:predicted Fe-S protein YdhL (DUF1289 family)
MSAKPSAAPQPVPSPCVNVCRMNEAKGVCEGCWRTLDEIAVWSLLDEAEKRAVWSDLARRRPPEPGAPGAPSA